MPEDRSLPSRVQVFRNGEPSGFPVAPDALRADAEGFTLVFDPEMRWFSWTEGYSLRIGDV